MTLQWYAQNSSLHQYPSLHQYVFIPALFFRAMLTNAGVTPLSLQSNSGEFAYALRVRARTRGARGGWTHLVLEASAAPSVEVEGPWLFVPPHLNLVAGRWPRGAPPNAMQAPEV